jgi:carotenoid cleavage dioxygenase-like enzyme
MDRRSFLRGLAGSSAVLAGSLVAGCGRGGGSDGPPGAAIATTAPSGTTAAPEPPIDPDRPWWMQGGFAPVEAELHEVDLEVTGSLPPALSGLYVRNGSNPASGPSPHWFLGDGMVHGVRLEAGGAAWYRNRWVSTPLYEAGIGFGEAPPVGATTLANVSVVHHGGRLLALGEVGFPYELRTDDLGTVGPFDHAGRLTTSMTAHPKIDPSTGRMHGFGYGFVPPFLTYHVIEPDGTLVHSEEIEVAGPTMIHDFAITEHHAVFWELPVTFDMDAALSGSDMPFRWDPGYGARVGLLPLGGPASEVRWAEIEPCYVFHGVNAWEDGAHVVLDVCRHPSMFEASATGLGGEGGEVRRWRVAAEGPTGVTEEVLEGERRLELPTVDRRFTGRPARHAWLVETLDDPSTVRFTGVVRRDARTGALDTWAPGGHEAPGEVTFVPDGEGAGEGEGWALTLTADPVAGTSDLVVLDATDLAAGPVARVHLPARVPFGFHGTWVAEA